MKTCSSCNNTKSFSEFNKNNSDKSGYSSKCKQCSKEYSREWHKKNYKKKFPDKVDKDGNLLCTQCKEYFPKDQFHKGKTSWCNNCQKEYDLKRIDKFRVYPRKLNELGQIHCRNCGEYFDEKDMVVGNKRINKGLTYCKECSSILKTTRTINNYGITVDQFHELLEKQNYSCRICGLKDSTYRVRLSIDHDHSCCPGRKSCGKCIRGLLCHPCNMALGSAKDDIEILQKMINYLKSDYVKF